jgi:AraC-like DNA-binding protein
VGGRFSTAEVGPGEQVEYWREMVRRHFVPLRIEPIARGEFDGSVRLRALGDLDIAGVHAHPMRVARGQRHIEQSAGDEYFIGLHIRGRALARQDRRAATLLPGDFALFDSARPYTIEFTDAQRFEHLIVRIPRELLDARCAELHRATSVAVRVGSQPGRLASPALTQLASLSEEADALVEPVLDLLVRSLVVATGLDSAMPTARERSLRQVQRYTLAHLSDPELAPADVATACFISVRHLHRLFAGSDTTFRSYVREMRLRRCRHDLEDRTMDATTIAEVAHRHGFRSAPVFTRAFTRRYGLGPRELRAQVARDT